MQQPNLQETFSAFFQNWLIKHQQFIDQLVALSVSSPTENTNTQCKEAITRALSVSSPTENTNTQCKEAITRVLDHYKDYIKHKNTAAKEDVLLVLSAPWCTAFERTLMWVSGFKPSMVYPLIKNSVGKYLSEEQLEGIERIRSLTRRKEREVEEAMARVQESMARPHTVKMIRIYSMLAEGEIGEIDGLESGLEELKEAMIVVMEKADGVRGLTMKKVMEILNLNQCVKFLAALSEFLLRARSLGKQRECERGGSAVGGSGEGSGGGEV